VTVHGRLMAWYATATGSAGAFPFLATALSARGATGPEIASLLVLFPIGVLVGGPLWGWAADRTGGRGMALRLSTGGGFVSWACVCASPTMGWMSLWFAVFAMFRSAQAGLGDATTLAVLGEDRASYGRIRAPGSIGYAAVVGVAGLLAERDASAPLWLGLAFIGLSHAVSWTLPSAGASAPRVDGEAGLFGHPVLTPLFLMCLLNGVPLNAYDALFPLHVEQLGLPPRVAGAAIALGVSVEVGVLWFARRMLLRFGALQVLVAALVLSEVRWLLTATVTDPVVLVGVQGLHGVCFGGFWVAAVALTGQYAPPRWSGTALAVLPAVTFGAGPLCSMTIAHTWLASGTVADLFRLGCVIQLMALALVIPLRRASDAQVVVGH